MPGSPSRRVTRRHYWHQQIRRERDPLRRFALAADYFRAMAAEGERTIPRLTIPRVNEITEALIADADELGAQIPAKHLERTVPR